MGHGHTAKVTRSHTRFIFRSWKCSRPWSRGWHAWHVMSRRRSKSRPQLLRRTGAHNERHEKVCPSPGCSLACGNGLHYAGRRPRRCPARQAADMGNHERTQFHRRCFLFRKRCGRYLELAVTASLDWFTSSIASATASSRGGMRMADTIELCGCEHCGKEFPLDDDMTM